jgi:hypothetical protein
MDFKKKIILFSLHLFFNQHLLLNKYLVSIHKNVF